MKTTEFHDKVLDRFTSNITDRVFLMIQSDRELMEDYLNLLEGNKRNIINSEIAKAIKERFSVNNDKESKNPESNLIKSFMKFKK